ncbi:hypothetical protein SFR_6920 (plasmid) [Streptomyces sp. FR-008]|nr:hypothetical protein SFR_6920 [Streptomyces sp. FR-008]
MPTVPLRDLLPAHEDLEGVPGPRLRRNARPNPVRDQPAA